MNINILTSCIYMAGILFVRGSSILCSWGISCCSNIVVNRLYKKTTCFFVFDKGVTKMQMSQYLAFFAKSNYSYRISILSLSELHHKIKSQKIFE